MDKQPKKHSCRWYDFNMDCCRNLWTHPCVFRIDGMVIRTEPSCECRKNCGYEKADADHPRWDAENDEFGGEE